MLCVQHRREADRFLEEFRERLAKFGLELHREKTRLIEFGLFAKQNLVERGEGEVESFTFLEFSRYCGVSSRGNFAVWRRTARMHELLRVGGGGSVECFAAITNITRCRYAITGTGKSIFVACAEKAQSDRAAWRGPDPSISPNLLAEASRSSCLSGASL